MGRGRVRRRPACPFSARRPSACPWAARRVFCVIDGPSVGRPWTASAARCQLRRLAAEAGVRRRFAAHQLRHAHAIEMAREGVPLNIIQRQLGHTDLGVTSTYLQGSDNAEIATNQQPGFDYDLGPMRRGGPSLLTLAYVVIGAFVAGMNGYFRSVSDFEAIVSALLAIFLWPLVLLGIDLRL
ncbi:MAG: site-specific integrase [Actinobacteria bacterium]|nr:site-specific integrase [Actinomycetota bacterium]